jgi:uncharacterized protein YdhG (YjbR/CyaY superfamily)
VGLRLRWTISHSHHNHGNIQAANFRPYDTSGTTIHFPAKNPLSASLVKKIIKARIEENEAKAKNTYTK